MIGKTILHYKILEKLGEGGMGVVYKAEDSKLKRTVALKFLPLQTMAGEEEKSRFEHEAQAAAALDHPNICTVYEINEADGQGFIAMAFVEGQSLQDVVVGAQHAVPLPDILHYAIQIAEGLQAAHKKDIVHRDIKPANILLTEENQVRITDFGLAKLAGRTQLTKEGTSMGTIAYMSPEQTQGIDVDHRTDIWALGAVIYEMITGKQPFAGDYEQAVMYSIMNEDPEPPTTLRTGVPMELERIVLKALAKEPGERYQRIDEMLVDLKNLQKSQESGVSKTQTSGRVEKTGRPHRVALTKRPILVGGLLILFAAITFLLLKPFLQDEPAVSGPRPVVVMPFENQTGDASLDYLKAAIPNLLITNLEQSKYLSVLTWQRMGDLLKQLGKDSIEVVEMDQQTGFELCNLDGVNGIVLGSFTKAGDIFATDIKVLAVDSKKTLKSANARGKGVGSILESQIDALSKDISQVVAVLPEEAEAEELRVADVTTNSIEAYRHYLDGVSYYNDFNRTEAKARFTQALVIDSNFAMAHAYLAWTEGWLGNSKAAVAAARKAMAYATRATPKEALEIRASYAIAVERDPQKAIRISEELTANFPREKDAHEFLGNRQLESFQYKKSVSAFEACIALDPNMAIAYNGLGYAYAGAKQYDKALASLRKYAELSPDNANPDDSIGDVYWMIGRLDEANSLWQKAFDKDPTFHSSLVKQARAHATKDDYTQVRRVSDKLSDLDKQFPALREIPRYQRGALWLEGFLNFYSGRHQNAFRLYAELSELNKKAGNTARMAHALRLQAMTLVQGGDFEKAEKHLQQDLNLRLTPLPQDSLRWRFAYHCLSGLSNAYAGKAESAQEKLAQARALYARLAPERVEVEAEWMARLEGEIALLQGDVREAIRTFKRVLPPNPYPWSLSWDYYVPVQRDGLARAYTANGDLDAALAEYRKLVKFDPAQKGRYPIDPKNHYRLAKLYQEKGWPGLALQEYAIFLERWQNADEGLPELMDAREQLAKMKGSAK